MIKSITVASNISTRGASHPFAVFVSALAVESHSMFIQISAFEFNIIPTHKKLSSRSRLLKRDRGNETCVRGGDRVYHAVVAAT